MRFYIICSVLACTLLTSCAKQGTPTGGPKDTTAPVMDTLKSTPNYQKRFSQQKIALVFNEWVVLKEATQQVVVSPPLEKNPKITLKNKTVTVDLGIDSLRSNTTYTINFGTAIRDFHEDNPAVDLRFVFSTGDVLDSLSLRGTVTDALTGKAKEKVTVMLYDEQRDSIILKKKPYYFARTDKNGQFLIQNIKKGAFKCVAIDEGDTPDLKWRDNEAIGFTAQPVVLGDSAKAIAIQLTVSKNKQIARMSDRTVDRYGVIRLGYTALPDQIQYRLLEDAPANLVIREERSQDTLLLWYHTTDSIQTTPWRLIAGERDTVVIKPTKRTDFLAKHRLRLSDDAVSSGPRGGRGGPPRTTNPATRPVTIPPAPVKSIQLVASKSVLLQFTAPLVAFDTSKWRIKEDSIEVRDFTAVVDSTSPRKLNLRKAWKPGKNYALELLPGAVTDLYGTSNTDTIRRNLVIMSEKQLGTINLTVEGMLPGKHYVLQLMRETDVEEERRFVAESDKQRFIFAQLLTTTYSARLIEDTDQNGRWDTVDYFAGKQAEQVFNKTLEALKPNWELEATIQAFKDTGTGKKREPKKN